MQDQPGPNHRVSPNPLGCLAIVCFVGLLIWFFATNVKESNPPAKEGTVTLQGPGVDYVPFALDENALDQMMWLDNESPIYLKRRSDSIKAFNELTAAQRVLKMGDANEPPSSIKVKILETKPLDLDVPVLAPPHKVKVTIMSGIHEGKTGWVSSRWIAK